MIILTLFALVTLLMVVGMPVALAMGLSAFVVVLLKGDINPIVMAQRMFVGVDSLPLLAIPYFILAGALMEMGGISLRLVRFASALVGHIRGGLGMVTVVASMIFAGISGSAAADTSAIGSIMMPAMIRRGYKRGFVVVLQASAGTIGPIIPPSILMIIYGSMTGLSVGRLFMAGLIPGILVGVSLMTLTYYYARRDGYQGEARATWGETAQAAWQALPALALPLVIIGGILGGIFTATEAGVTAVVYAIIVGFFVYRELKLRDLPRILANAAMTSFGLLFIVANAAMFGWVLAREEFPRLTVGFLTSLTNDPHIILLLVILFLLLIGCFVETISAMIILVPMLFATGAAYRIDPIHFATMIVILLLIGTITPPVGILLYLTCAMTKTPISEALKYITPFVIAMLAVVLLVAFLPQLSLFVPHLIFGK
jgi:tripartite ATP-independent transporter DctM subunit